MTVAQLAKYIGQTGFISYDRMNFEVMVIDVRQAWGDIQVLVTPSHASLAGAGAAWKSGSSVQGLEVK